MATTMDQFLTSFSRLSSGEFSIGIVKDAVQTFFTSVTWQDPGIISLLLFHFLLYTIAKKFMISTSNLDNNQKQTNQMIVFAINGALVMAGKPLNTICRNNFPDLLSFQLFTQNYFDKRGIFIAVMWCFPIICLMTMQTVNMLWSVLLLMRELVKKKRMLEEIQKKKKKK